MDKTTAISSSSSFVQLFRPRRQIPKKHLINNKKCSLRLKVVNVSISVEQSKKPVNKKEEGDDGNYKDAAQIIGIEVPRQSYIPISKSDLLDAILLLFESQFDKDQFLLFSSCLDSIIHAEHKKILEDMRLDYHHQHPHDSFSNENKIFLKNNTNMEDGEKEEEQHVNGNVEQESPPNLPNSLISTLDLRTLLGSLPENSNKSSTLKHPRVDVATRFQRSFVQLLGNAQFEELSARDLILTSALNSDYLLTLPIYVDWKKASESNAIIFRRGYATERQRGLLVAEKLDYLQSKILQELFFLICKPLGRFGVWISEAVKTAGQGQDPESWTERVKLWLKEFLLPQDWDSYSEKAPGNILENDQILASGPNIWLAAQKAVTRYEGILSPIGPRGRLLRKLLIWIGLIPPISKKAFDLEPNVTTFETYLRPIILSRMTLADIWEPATWKHCGNNIWKMLKTATSILFSQSVLQEPAFEELILLFTEEKGKSEDEDTADMCSLQLKVYKRIPIPDLPVIFPHKKLSFRILDTVRLDIATLVGLLAFLINYKFEDILSSPSALMLDVITVSALIIYVSRVALGYKQTWDRYQLLVNKTLYEKTMASGFGSVHFLLDASEQQQYKEAILTYVILLKSETNQIITIWERMGDVYESITIFHSLSFILTDLNLQSSVTCPNIVKDKCERFMYNTFKEKVDMPIDKAMETLKRLDLIKERVVDHKQVSLQAIPCSEAYHILQCRWNTLLS